MFGREERAAAASYTTGLPRRGYAKGDKKPVPLRPLHCSWALTASVPTFQEQSKKIKLNFNQNRI